ncbi:MAG: alpha,alpha-trehalase TreF [Caulobacteraceae bacterium]
MKPCVAALLLALLPTLAAARPSPPADGAVAPANDAAWQAYAKAAATPTPSVLLGPLYAEVELRGLFADNKLFADAVPRRSLDRILADYRAGGPWTNEALKGFVRDNFILPVEPSAAAATVTAPTPLDVHIANLWPMLARPGPTGGGSALSLPERYVAPGGRFRELYYWDSYFTMLGLIKDGRGDLVESMIDDFGSLIDRYGHIPNGARTYYLTRSQPPLFYAMVGLSQAADPAVRARRLGWMKQEHAYWMAGLAGLKPGAARLHVVVLADGAVLNRYFDLGQTPRDESYALDVRLAAHSGRPAAEVYADVRAAAESGWDFSSRWFADGRTLETIDTRQLVEPDLNSLLFGLERAIAKACAEGKDLACADAFNHQADARARAMRRWLWDDQAGIYRDYNWRKGALTPSVSAATLYPLFVGAAAPADALRVAAFVRAQLLAPGGVRSTTVSTGQQWDEPNGWAPLQWIAVDGLQRYGQDELSDLISCRWLHAVQLNYQASGKLVEKYDIESVRPGGGGEYPLQDGFGWTNGVSSVLHCKAG